MESVRNVLSTENEYLQDDGHNNIAAIATFDDFQCIHDVFIRSSLQAKKFHVRTFLKMVSCIQLSQ